MFIKKNAMCTIMAKKKQTYKLSKKPIPEI